MEKQKTKYPVYVLSKGRYDCCLTAKFLIEDNVDFYLVVETEEYEKYRKSFPTANILVLPPEKSNKGAVSTRNWIWSHSISNGHERHWEFDDNIRMIVRLHKGKRIRCNAGVAIRIVEDYTDRYENIAISGFNYTMFVMDDCKYQFFVNCHVYSGMLIRNHMPYRWRLAYNADTDLCLQVLHDKWCTVSFNQFSIHKMATMTMKGGNTKRYQGDGRYKMAKILEMTWPQYVKTSWKFGRPQHSVAWPKYFKQPLIRKKNIDWSKVAETKYDIELKVVQKVKSKSLNKWLSKYKESSNEHIKKKTYSKDNKL